MDSDLLARLNLETFIALDTETTGLDPLTDDIIEFGAVKYTAGEPVDSMSLLLKPSGNIPEEITRITGITDEMVADSPHYAEKHEEIRDFLGTHPLVAHNVEFDAGMLESHYQKAGDEPPENRLYDTLFLSRTFVYWLVDHKLRTVARAFDAIDRTEHRALTDATMCGRIFLELVRAAVATPLDPLRQINRILADTDLHSKQLIIDAANYLIAKNEKEGIGRPSLMPPNRYNVYGESKLGFDKAGEPPEPIDTFELTRHFTSGGTLASTLENFEQRDAQAGMAEAVADAFNEGHFLVAEAGTGVGKSLAYLLPSVSWVMRNNELGERVVISSNTKNLQEQLFFKEIPFLFERMNLDFKAVLLKGRSNYLCKTKWTDFLRHLPQFSASDRLAAATLPVWISQTRTGDISEHNGFNEGRNSALWGRLSSEGGYCTTRRCNSFNGCFLGPLKREAATAHLLLVNHSLLLADAASGHQVIPEYHHLIVDEAHNLEGNAYRFFASEFDLWSVRNLIRPLYTRGRNDYGLLITLQTAIGQLEDEEKRDALETAIDQAVASLKNLDQTTEEFLTNFQYRVGANRDRSRYTLKQRYTREENPFDEMGEEVNEVTDTFREVLDSLKHLWSLMQELSTDDLPDADLLRQDLQQGYDDLREKGLAFHFITGARDGDSIYWYEIPVSERALPRLIMTPLRVGRVLQEQVYDFLRTGILTSATLKVADEFTYFLTRAGLDESLERTVVTSDFGSPYYLSEQLMGCVASYLAKPGTREHSKQVADIMHHISRNYQRGMLVLTTSYQSLSDMYTGVEGEYRQMDIGLFRQTSDISRTDLVERFREEISSVLIGTESFWEGVDVPGKALEVLLISKLPFAVPSDPIVQANSAAIEADGGNGFLDYFLPEAIIQFRQGFGRLIRSSEDAGIVIIADPRVATKQYGRFIAESLPIELQVCQSEGELHYQLENWFRQN